MRRQPGTAALPVSSWTFGPMPAWPSRLGSARNRKWKHRALAKQASTFDDVEALRRSILVALLIFTTAFGAGFAVLNYFNANYTAMAGEITMGLFALCLVPVIRRTAHLVRWSFVYLVLFNTTMMLILSTPQSSPVRAVGISSRRTCSPQSCLRL